MDMTFSYDELRKAVEAAGHKWFTGHMNVNLIGIRTDNVEAGQFDDYLVMAYEVGQHQRVQVFPATTDPGSYYLANPLRVDGTAIMAPGQYRGAYVIGKHKNKPAMVNRGKTPPDFFRDGDRDNILETDGPRITGQYVGLNIHRSGSSNYASKGIGKWSAGCQVFAYDEDMELWLHVCRRSAKHYGEFFTYTLIEQWW